MTEYLLVLTTVPNEKAAGEISRQLVEARLAACVTISNACQSFYWWENNIIQDQEFMLFIKSKKSLWPLLEKKLQEIHPYSVPEILAFSVETGLAKYLDWLEKETRQG